METPYYIALACAREQLSYSSKLCTATIYHTGFGCARQQFLTYSSRLRMAKPYYISLCCARQQNIRYIAVRCARQPANIIIRLLTVGMGLFFIFLAKIPRIVRTNAQLLRQLERSRKIFFDFLWTFYMIFFWFLISFSPFSSTL